MGQQTMKKMGLREKGCAGNLDVKINALKDKGRTNTISRQTRGSEESERRGAEKQARE